MIAEHKELPTGNLLNELPSQLVATGDGIYHRWSGEIVLDQKVNFIELSAGAQKANAKHLEIKLQQGDLRERWSIYQTAYGYQAISENPIGTPKEKAFANFAMCDGRLVFKKPHKVPTDKPITAEDISLDKSAIDCNGYFESVPQLIDYLSRIPGAIRRAALETELQLPLGI